MLRNKETASINLYYCYKVFYQFNLRGKKNYAVFCIPVITLPTEPVITFDLFF